MRTTPIGRSGTPGLGGAQRSGDPAATVPALIEALVAADHLVNSMMAMRTELIEAVRVASLLTDDDGSVDTAGKESAPTDDQLAARAAMVTEMSCALRLPEGTMDALVDQAKVLMTHLPGTADALRAGSISYRHAQVMVEQLEGLDPSARAELEVRLLPRAGLLSVARFKNAARRERERLDPVPLSVRHERAGTGRRVYLEHADDGMSWIHALLPATVATAAFNRLSAVAASLQHPDDGRSLPQLRADALAALLVDDDARESLRAFHDAAAAASGADHARSAGPTSGTGPTRGTTTGAAGEFGTGPACGCFPAEQSTGAPSAGPPTADERRSEAWSAETQRRREHMRQALRRIRATVAITVPVLTLLGGDDPGELEGYGPIDPDTARELCAGAPSFMRLLTHPHTGVVMGVGRDRYSPPADLRAALRLRDQTCRFPGCPRAAQRCDLDHVEDWAAGGPTDQTNLIHLCRRHHRLRHTTGWEAEVITHLYHTVDGTKGAARTAADDTATRPLPAMVRWTSPSGRTYVTDDPHTHPSRSHEERTEHDLPWGAPVTGDDELVTAHVPPLASRDGLGADPVEPLRHAFPAIPPF